MPRAYPLLFLHGEDEKNRKTLDQEMKSRDLLVDGRYIGPVEAVWRLLGFRMHKAFHPVIKLHMHPPGQFMHAFNPNESLESIRSRAEKENAMLTAFFRNNYEHPDEPGTTYPMFPRTHVYKTEDKEWKLRRKGMALGRLFFCSRVLINVYW
jgi:hypothetical protein